MEKIIIALLLVTTACNGRIEITDSKHTVEYTIALQEIRLEIEEMCREAYLDETTVKECIMNIMQQFLNTLNNTNNQQKDEQIGEEK